MNNLMQILQRCITTPLKSLYSLEFYTKLLFRTRGLGLTYIFALCAAFAIPASFKVVDVLESLKGLELPRIVGQIPPSNINKNGVLSASDPNTKDVVIYNSKQQPIIAYNPNNTLSPEQLSNVTIILNTNSLGLRTADNLISVPWSSIYDNQDVAFEPLAGAQMVETAVNASLFTVWSVVTIWFSSFLLFSVLMAGILSKLVLFSFFKIKLVFVDSFRMSAYASTIVVFAMTLQFFINFSMSTITMILIPSIFVVSTLVFLKKRFDKIEPNKVPSSNDPSDLPYGGLIVDHEHNVFFFNSKFCGPLTETVIAQKSAMFNNYVNKQKQQEQQNATQEQEDSDKQGIYSSESASDADIKKERPEETSDQSQVTPDSSIKGPSFNQQTKGSEFNEDMPIFSDQDNAENPTQKPKSASDKEDLSKSGFFNP